MLIAWQLSRSYNEILLFWLEICRRMWHDLWCYLPTIGTSNYRALIVWILFCCYYIWLLSWAKALICLVSSIATSTSISLFKKDHLLWIQMLLLFWIVKSTLCLIHLDQLHWRVGFGLRVWKGQLFCHYELCLSLESVLCLYLLLVLLILQNHFLFPSTLDMSRQGWLLILELLVLDVLLFVQKLLLLAVRYFVCWWCGRSRSLFVILRVEITYILHVLLVSCWIIDLLLFLFNSSVLIHRSFHFLYFFEIRTAHHANLIFVLLLRNLLILLHILFNFLPGQILCWSCWVMTKLTIWIPAGRLIRTPCWKLSAWFLR